MSTQTRRRLSRLPVPPLRQTLDRYLRSVEPFLLEDEARGGTPFASSYALRAQWARSFENGIGRLCQDRLLGKYFFPPFCASHLMGHPSARQNVAS
jgi:hypothetical protein